MLILLTNVEKGGSIDTLLNSGLSFQEIADLTQDALQKNFVSFESGYTSLTEIGLKVLTVYKAIVKNESKDRWISPEEVSKIPKISEDFIYLPNREDIP